MDKIKRFGEAGLYKLRYRQLLPFPQIMHADGKRCFLR